MDVMQTSSASCSKETWDVSGGIDWTDAFSEMSRKIIQDGSNGFHHIKTATSRGLVNFSQSDLNTQLFPTEEFKACMVMSLTRGKQTPQSNGASMGNSALREAIAQRMRQRGVSTSPDEILITGSIEESYHLVLRLLGQSDRRLIIEAPTNRHFITALRFTGFHVATVPMRDDGLDLDMLERTMQSNPPCLVYTIPNFHDPTGITTSQNHRERLLFLCEKVHVPIIEDGTQDEMTLFGKSIHPIKAMDHNGLVIYLGTFAPALSPTIRYGWIVAPRRCIRGLAAIQRMSCPSAFDLVQPALALFLQDGSYGLHLKRIHRIFQRRMQVAIQAVEAELPSDILWEHPKGGQFLWLFAPWDCSDTELLSAAHHNGIHYLSGSHYFYRDAVSGFLSLRFQMIGERRIEEGIKRLGCTFYQFKEDADRSRLCSLSE